MQTCANIIISESFLDEEVHKQNRRSVAICPEKKLSPKFKIFHTYFKTLKILSVSIGDRREFLDKAIPEGFKSEPDLKHGCRLVFVVPKEPVEDIEDGGDILVIPSVEQDRIDFSSSSSLHDDGLLCLTERGK